MKVTAATITDEQIRTLARTALTAAQHADCAVALGTYRTKPVGGGVFKISVPSAREIRAARARCARLINARSKS